MPSGGRIAVKAEGFIASRVDRLFRDTGAEKMVNLTTLYGFFISADLEPYSEPELRQLAEAIGECWKGVLSMRYPDREIIVRFAGEADGEYSPNVTFWTGPTHA